MSRILVLLSALLLAFSSYALDIDTAKTQGLVGEQTNGYIGLVANNHSEAAALVSSVNKLRKEKYMEIASKQKTALSNIETLAGSKLVERAVADGQYYQTSSGSWAR